MTDPSMVMTPNAAAPTPASMSQELLGLDHAVYQAVAATSTPRLDTGLRLLSTAADHSKLSMASAAVLALAGGRRGRRAAAMGLASVALTSATVNAVAKFAWRRPRPDREVGGVSSSRRIQMPTSSSFPSGHSAAAFAFATGVGHSYPEAAIPLRALAFVVAYSRVHTGVHYPGDVVAGSLMGGGLAQLTTHALERRWPNPHR